MVRLASVGVVALAGLILAADPAASAPKKIAEGPPPAQVTTLLNCRAITDNAERLACYDKAAAAVSEAVAKRDLVVMDRESVKKTKRGLFGFSIPNLGIFGDDDDEVEIKQIDGTLVSTAFNADGGYIFRLADGSRWTQIDSKPFAIPPINGDKVVVKKGTLGSYFMAVEGSPGVKVKRLN
ncbi:hypothetical protein [Sphingomonas sp.]|uniref:hypothetical protein n=1 Tax=Sphingomonas sp. TaxID=28214 RepID=UPI0025F5C620|nr:hypothetical protein [Sphingomonas sp.]